MGLLGGVTRSAETSVTCVVKDLEYLADDDSTDYRGGCVILNPAFNNE
jgi:hypothetical protein